MVINVVPTSICGQFDEQKDAGAEENEGLKKGKVESRELITFAALFKRE